MDGKFKIGDVTIETISPREVETLGKFITWYLEQPKHKQEAVYNKLRKNKIDTVVQLKKAYNL